MKACGLVESATKSKVIVSCQHSLFASVAVASDISIAELPTLDLPARTYDGPHILISQSTSDHEQHVTSNAACALTVPEGLVDSGLSTAGTSFRLRFGNGLSFTVRIQEQGALIGYTLGRQWSNGAALCHHLLDYVLPRVVAAVRGPVLHGALLDIGGEGVALIGASGAGKSTLAAALSLRGAKLASDDAIRLEKQTTSFEAIGTYPSLRLWPDSLRALFCDGYVATSMSGTTLKRRVEISSRQTTYIPLQIVFILDGPSRELETTRVRPAQSCMALTANAFQLDPADVRAAAATLSFMREVATEVPVFRISYPRTFEALPAVADAIIAMTKRLALPNAANRELQS